MNLLSKLSDVKTIFSRSLIIGVTTASLSGIALAQENPLIVEADESLQWLRAENKYVATGNASAEQGDLRLVANVIIADYEAETSTQGDYDASVVTFVEGKGNATLTRATLKATAGNITYDIMDEYIELKGNNPTVINGDDQMRAETIITYNRKTRQITANGNASVILSNGQTLLGDAITVTLNAEESDIDTVLAQGNAVVISPSETGERRAEAQEMNYSRATGLAIMTGAVILKDNNNIMTGDRAEIDTVTGTSTMKSLTKGQRVGGVFNPAQ